MRVVTLELLSRRIINTIEQSFTEHLPTPYLRSQAIAIVSLLSNLGERSEERAGLLQPQNQEMRDILVEIKGILSGVEGAIAINRAIGEILETIYPALAEENAALRRILYQAVEALYEWEGRLDGSRLTALREKLRAHLRRQLDQDLALYHPVRAGRMFRGA